MDVYNYDPSTGAYTTTEAARPDPLVPGRVLIPANATTVTPPTPGANQVAVFKSGAWSLAPNYVGQTWWTAWNASTQIDQIGVSPPDGATATQPPPPLAIVQQQQIGALRQSQQTALAAGVAYNGNTYPLDAQTQQQITALAAAVHAGMTFAANPQLATTAGAFVTLTPADCTALAQLALDQVISVGNQLTALIGQVMAATTNAAVQAITWPQG